MMYSIIKLLLVLFVFFILKCSNRRGRKGVAPSSVKMNYLPIKESVVRCLLYMMDCDHFLLRGKEHPENIVIYSFRRTECQPRSAAPPGVGDRPTL